MSRHGQKHSEKASNEACVYCVLIVPEGVVVVVVGGLEFDEHEIDCSDGGRQEEDFHRGVVEGDEAGKQVQVPRQEHQGKQDLSPT